MLKGLTNMEQRTKVIVMDETRKNERKPEFYKSFVILKSHTKRTLDTCPL